MPMNTILVSFLSLCTFALLVYQHHLRIVDLVKFKIAFSVHIACSAEFATEGNSRSGRKHKRFYTFVGKGSIAPSTR